MSDNVDEKTSRFNVQRRQKVDLELVPSFLTLPREINDQRRWRMNLQKSPPSSFDPFSRPTVFERQVQTFHVFCRPTGKVRSQKQPLQKV